MATEAQGFILSLPAAADLSGDQYNAIVIDSSGDAAIAGAGIAIAGLLQNKPDAAGKAASVQIDHVSKYVAGTGGVTAGDELETEAGGALITQSAGITVAYAKDTVAAAGIGSCLLKP